MVQQEPCPWLLGVTVPIVALQCPKARQSSRSTRSTSSAQPVSCPGAAFGEHHLRGHWAAAERSCPHSERCEPSYPRAWARSQPPRAWGRKSQGIALCVQVQCSGSSPDLLICTAPLVQENAANRPNMSQQSMHRPAPSMVEHRPQCCTMLLRHLWQQFMLHYGQCAPVHGRQLAGVNKGVV